MSLKIHFLISMLMVFILTMFMYIMKQNFKTNFSSNLNVECGFNSMNNKNLKFSNQFFMIAIIFVIFDMELIIIMPLPTLKLNFINMIFLFSILIILAFSLLMEWLNGMIEWIKS